MSASNTAERIKGILAVTVLQAKNLKKSDWIGENDCYVVVSLQPFSTEKKRRKSAEKEQDELCQKTQIHDGSNPIFDEKLLFPINDEFDKLYVQIWDSDLDKDDLLATGFVNLLDDEQGGIYDTNADKEWLHTFHVSLVDDENQSGILIDLVLHYIPQSVMDYLTKKFNTKQAEMKKKLTQQIIMKATDMATDKARAFAGLN